MYRYSTLLFDLDGTVTDSAEGILKSFKYGLSSVGIDETDDTKLRCIMGPPLMESFMSIYGLSREKAQQALIKYRERYTDTGIYEMNLYEGIRETLKKLKEDGFTIALATSKPEFYSKRIIYNFELTKYFDFVTGASLDDSRSTKEAVIEHILKELDIEDKSGVVMIGDRKHDLIGAKYHGIDAIGVLYGYGSEQELKSFDHVYLAKDAYDLYDYLTQNP